MREVSVVASMLCSFLGLAEFSHAFVHAPTSRRVIQSAAGYRTHYQVSSRTTLSLRGLPRTKYATTANRRTLRLASAGTATRRPSLKPSWKKPESSLPETSTVTEAETEAAREDLALTEASAPSLYLGEPSSKVSGKSFGKASWKSTSSAPKPKSSQQKTSTVTEEETDEARKDLELTEASAPSLDLESSKAGVKSFEKVSWSKGSTGKMPKQDTKGSAILGSKADSPMNMRPSDENDSTTTDSTTADEPSLFAGQGASESASPTEVTQEPELVGSVSSAFEAGSSLLPDAPTLPFKDPPDDVAVTLRQAKEALAPFQQQLRQNIAEGNVGERGEEWFVTQAAILLCVALGTIPVVGGIVMFLAGPGLVIVGLIVALSATMGLGRSLTPWPAPTEDNELSTSGIYGLMRHPQYSGLILLTLGFGVVTESPIRMLLAVVLALVLDRKAAKEEDLLLAKHGQAYESYLETVAKFIPRFY